MRSYAAQDIISLPSLSASGAVALGQGLLTAAQAQPTLPPLIATRVSALDLVYKALYQAVSAKPQAPPDPQRARTTDLAVDHAWNTFHHWLYAWTQLKQPDADQARVIYADIFPTRLKFTKLPYQLEWAEGDTRLNRITTNNFEPEIERLGGKQLLQQLRDAHKDYGEALGITALGLDPTTPSIREPLQAFTESLRAYVLTVAAHAVPEDPSSGALTDTLLAPLYRWQSYVSVSTQAETQPAQPAAPAAPGQVAPTPAAPTPAPANGPSAGGAAH